MRTPRPLPHSPNPLSRHTGTLGKSGDIFSCHYQVEGTTGIQWARPGPLLHILHGQGAPTAEISKPPPPPPSPAGLRLRTPEVHPVCHSRWPGGERRGPVVWGERGPRGGQPTASSSWPPGIQHTPQSSHRGDKGIRPPFPPPQGASPSGGPFQLPLP